MRRRCPRPGSPQIVVKIADQVGHLGRFVIGHMGGVLQRGLLQVILVDRQQVQKPGKLDPELIVTFELVKGDLNVGNVPSCRPQRQTVPPPGSRHLK